MVESNTLHRDKTLTSAGALEGSNQIGFARLPDGAFGYVPTPALVAPLEFTMPRATYEALGGHTRAIRDLEDVVAKGGEYGSAARIVGTRK